MSSSSIDVEHTTACMKQIDMRKLFTKQQHPPTREPLHTITFCDVTEPGCLSETPGPTREQFVNSFVCFLALLAEAGT